MTKPRSRVIVLCGDEVLLVENWLSSGRLALPGGGIEAGESSAAAAVRELYEELNVALDPSRLQPLGLQKSRENILFVSTYYLFAVQLPEKPVITRAKHEIMSAQWVSFVELEEWDGRLTRTVVDSVKVWLNH